MNLYSSSATFPDKPAARNANARGASIYVSAPNVAAIDLVAGTKQDQRRRLLGSPLVPTLIVDTPTHYQAWWALKGSLEHAASLTAHRLAPAFQAATATELLAPGFAHHGYVCAAVWRHQVTYSTRQLAQAFEYRPRYQPPVADLLVPAVERRLVGALIASPDSFATFPLSFGLDVLADMHASYAFEAFVHVLAHGGDPTPATVKQALISRVDFRRQALQEPAERSRFEWFDALPFDARTREQIQQDMHVVLAAAERRAKAITRDDEARRLEAELDDVALRDVA